GLDLHRGEPVDELPELDQGGLALGPGLRGVHRLLPPVQGGRPAAGLLGLGGEAAGLGVPPPLGECLIGGDGALQPGIAQPREPFLGLWREGGSGRLLEELLVGRTGAHLLAGGLPGTAGAVERLGRKLGLRVAVGELLVAGGRLLVGPRLLLAAGLLELGLGRLVDALLHAPLDQRPGDAAEEEQGDDAEPCDIYRWGGAYMPANTSRQR